MDSPHCFCNTREKTQNKSEWVIRQSDAPATNHTHTHQYTNKTKTHHVELRNGRPHWKILDTRTDGLVAENVDRVKVNVVGLQYLAGGVAESTLRKELASLHEQQDGVVFDQGLDAFLGVLGGFLTKVVEGHGERSTTRDGARTNNGNGDSASGCGRCEGGSGRHQHAGDQRDEENRSRMDHFENWYCLCCVTRLRSDIQYNIIY